MKYLFTVVCCMLALSYTSNAQRVVPFKAILQTKEGKMKGVLQRVDTNAVLLNVDGKFVGVKFSDIKTAKIRVAKKGYKAKLYLPFNDNEDKTYRLNSNGEMVDQWGKQAPSLEDEATNSIMTVVFNGIVNVVAWPIHAVNPNLSKFKINGKADSSQIAQLGYYSIAYQARPNTLADLRKLKEVADKARKNKN